MALVLLVREQISDSDMDSTTAVTIDSVSLEPSSAVADLQYRRSADSMWRTVPGGLSGITEPGVGVPLFDGFQLRIVPLPNVDKVSGCVEYTLRAYDNSTRNTSGLFDDGKGESGDCIK